MTLSRRGLTVWFIVVLVGYAAVALAVLDMRKRRHFQEATGINAFGFQNDPRIHKLANERRIVLVGGAEAFGAGKPTYQTPAFVFQRYVNQPWRPQFRGDFTTVIGLSEVGAGAGSYVQTLQRYHYLTPDAICLFDGYAPVDSRPAGGGREASAVFRRFGYLPALAGPGAIVPPAQVPMDPSLRDDATGDASCAGTSAAYCTAMANAVSWGLSHNTPVVVITPPYVSKRHEVQQQSLGALLKERFGSDKRFSYDNEGPALDMHRDKWSADGVHLTAAGIERLADNLVAPLIAAAHQ